MFSAVDATNWQKGLLTVTYYLLLDNKVVALYFSLADDKITTTSFPQSISTGVRPSGLA